MTMINILDCALVYVATGDSYIIEASESALTSRRFLEGITICLFTDNVEYASGLNSFDHLYHLDNPTFSYRDKVQALRFLPFKYNLFLDSDAALVSSVIPIFEMLSFFDLLAVRAPVRYPSGWIDHKAPLLFPELNTGVLAIRRSLRQRLLFASWLYLYDYLKRKYSQVWDQASFRSCLWFFIRRLGYKFLSLPEEVNLRITKPWIAGKGLSVFVVHGRIPVEERDHFFYYLNRNINRFRSWAEWLELNPNSSIRPILPDM